MTRSFAQGCQAAFVTIGTELWFWLRVTKPDRVVEFSKSRIDVVANSIQRASSIAGVLPITALGPLVLLIRTTLPIDCRLLGSLFGMFFAGALAGTLAGSWVMGRIGSASSIAIGALVSGASCAAIGFANWTHLLVIVFVLAGAANGLIQPGVNVYIVQKVPERFRGLSFGLPVAGTPAAGGLAALAGFVMAAHLNQRRRYGSYGTDSRPGSSSLRRDCGVGFGWAWPGLLDFAALMMHPRAHGAVASQMQFANCTGAILGPVVFGFFVNGGYQVFACSLFGLLTLISAAAMVVVIVMTRRS